MSRKKQIYFSILLAVLPLVLLAMLEGGLWLFNAFPEPPLFLEKTENGRAVYQLNPYVGQRYFPADSPALPTLYPETFARQKAPGTLRIFCLGGSSAAGFPFEYQVPFPKQLQFLLMDAQPDKNIEVINLGLSAINSFSVLDLLPEVLEAEPDVLLFYMGHNEFYGVYGSASSFSIGQSGGWIRFYLRLQKFRITRMVKTVVERLSPAPASAANSDESLMSAVIGDRAIPLNSEKYRRTMDNFRENLQRIFAMCRKKNVPVIAGDLIANEKDLPPFAVTHRVGLSDSEQREFATLLKAADSLLSRQEPPAAEAALSKALNIDSTHATAHYLLGKSLLATGDSLAARQHFRRAADLDVIRFRATTDANRIIRETTQRFGFKIAEVEAAFRQASPGGVIGATLVCDHLHPNPDGYWLMAKAFYRAITEYMPERQLVTDHLSRPRPYFVTALDWEIGLLKIHKMTRRWPFPAQPDDFADYAPYLDKNTAKIALEYIHQHQNWAKAHFDLAAIYEENNQPAAAIAELQAVSAIFTDQHEPLAAIARIHNRTGNLPKAAVYYQRVTQMRPNEGMAHYQLAMIRRQLNDLPGAIASMQNAAYARDFSEKERLNARYYLAGFLADNRDTAAAQKVLRELLKENPGFVPAQRLLQQLATKSTP